VHLGGVLADVSAGTVSAALGDVVSDFSLNLAVVIPVSLGLIAVIVVWRYVRRAVKSL